MLNWKWLTFLNDQKTYIVEKQNRLISFGANKIEAIYLQQKLNKP